MTGPRGLHDPVGTGVAALLVALGIVLIRQTGAMTPLGSVFPITVSAAMIVLGVILILRNVVLGLRASQGAGESADTVGEESEASGGSVARRAAFLGVMVLWVAMLTTLGFFTASLLGFLAVMATALHDRVSLREGVLLAVSALVIVGGFYWVMRDVLLIPLPRGLFF